ncbi:hypothetical protein [Thiomicrorhabdus sp. Kp2]|uniref:hypothetical protein n=1 Tax=Thiomicrorhabdus sp. Kp2 TaxID=1123518 RepID=UPI0003FFCA8A|nr:hypothetical protein [Thiomicrorhabdus sp. Kp2]
MANTTGRKFGGRQKGTPNKTTLEIKEAIIEAFNKAGGVDYLVGLAKENPSVFAGLLSKVLPRDVNVEAVINKSAKSKEEIESELVALGIDPSKL